MNRSTLLVSFLSLSAAAEPAVVTVFEAIVRERPEASAPQLHAFPEKAEVSVSEESQNGWRRVRTPSGAVGWIREKDIRVGVTATATATASTQSAAASPPPATDAPRRALIYVKDLKHFAELTRADEVVHPKATELATRSQNAEIARWGGVGVGLALMAGALLLAPPGTSQEPGREETFYGLTIGGGVVAVVGVGIALLLIPRREDIIDVVNEWNTRHPADPFELNDEGRSSK